MKHRKKVMTVIGTMEVVILAICASWIFRFSKTDLDVELKDWKSDYILFENDEWNVQAEELSSGEIDLLYGPYTSIEKGAYTVNIFYECEEDQEVLVYANAGNDYFLKANKVTLCKNLKSLSYDFEVTKDIENLEIVVKYNGNGAFKITDISIASNSNILKRGFVYLFIFFAIIDILVIFYKQIYLKKNIIFSILGITFLTSIPLFNKGLYGGHDGMFHLMRIEGIATELQHGNFPARIQSLWMDGYGYPVSVYYGDLLLYFPALLRLAGFPVTVCFKSYMLMINFLTTVISFFCFKKISKKKNISLVMTLVYMTASYRLINVYIREAVGEFTAMMFLPIIAASIYGIYAEKENEWKNYRKNALLLALGMVGLIGTHILSTEMVCITLLLIVIVFIKKTITKNVIRVYVLAVAETILLSLFFLVPFLDYYVNCKVNINNTINIVKTIQYGGGYLTQYFAFWQNIYGENSAAMGKRFQMTPGMGLMVTLIAALAVWCRGKANKQIKLLTLFSIFFLYMASNLFPWDFIAQYSKVGNYLAQVQFPWRYLEIAVIFLTLLLGELLKVMPENLSGVSKEAIHTVIYGICIFTMCSFASGYCNELSVVNYYDTAELNTKRIHGGAEYLLVGTDRNSLSNEIISKNVDHVEVIERVGNYIKLSCDAGTAEGTIELPLYNYKGYQVTDEYGNEYAIWNGTNNVIGFTLPADFSGVVTVQFIEPWYWKCAMYISILGLLGIAIFEKRDVIDAILHGKRCKKQNECI